MPQFTKNNHLYCFYWRILSSRYGKVFKSSVLGRFTVFMTGREASKILLTGKDGTVSLNLFYTGKQVFGPTSLLQTTGEMHKRLRRLIVEPLSLDGLKNYFQFINMLAIQPLDQWPGRRVFVLEEASTVEFWLYSQTNIILPSLNAVSRKINKSLNIAVHSQSDWKYDNELRAHWRGAGEVSGQFQNHFFFVCIFAI